MHTCVSEELQLYDPLYNPFKLTKGMQSWEHMHTLHTHTFTFVLF